MTPQETTMHAKLLADNPLLTEMFDAIESGLILKAKNANLSNDKELMAITLGFQIKEQMQQFIQICIDDEKVVEYNQKKQSRFL